MSTKKRIILAFAIIYGLLSLLLFSEAFITQLLEAKKNYYLTETKNFEVLIFTTKSWQELGDTKEFKFKGDYYDVKKIKKCQNKVVVTVIRDEYENLIKYISSHIHPRKVKDKTSKNKKVLDICCIQPVTETASRTTHKIQNNYPLLHLFSKWRLKTIFRPPCIEALLS